MRKILITVGILVFFVVALSALWIFRGRQLSLFIDRFETIETASARINSIAYEGSGTGGILRVNDLGMSLNDRTPAGASPSIGSTKDNQVPWLPQGKMPAIVSQLYHRQATMLSSESEKASLAGRRHLISIS